MFTIYESTCNVCGNTFDNDCSHKPKQYCSSNCRNYMKYKNALERVLISLELTDEARKIIKGDMFRLSNLLGNGTKRSPEDFS